MPSGVRPITYQTMTRGGDMPSRRRTGVGPALAPANGGVKSCRGGSVHNAREVSEARDIGGNGTRRIWLGITLHCAVVLRASFLPSVTPGSAILLWLIMSGGRTLMRAVCYSPRASTVKFAFRGTISRGCSSGSRHFEGGANNNSAEEADKKDPQGSSAPPAVDADAESYGGIQQHQAKVADRSHEEHVKRGIDQESFRDVGYDMSKVTRPSGDE